VVLVPSVLAAFLAGTANRSFWPIYVAGTANCAFRALNYAFNRMNAHVAVRSPADAPAPRDALDDSARGLAK
jgi:hypothetical protein